MSFGFLGIQFGFALQNANVSRIFQTLGADVENIPILWIAAPVTGLLVQPIIGYMSDKTWNRLGRRRPYFLFGAIFASIALFIMPNSPFLWVAAGMLWIMDASINISMEPFRAFVGDMLPPEQRNQGFVMQSFFIGIGAVIASLLPTILTQIFGVSNTAPEGIIPPSVKISFYIGGIIFLIAVAWTVFRTKEYPPKDLEEFDEYEKKYTQNDSQTKESQSTENKKTLSSNYFFSRGLIWSIVGIILTYVIYYFQLEKELYILGGGIMFYGIIQLICSLLKSAGKSKNGLVEIITDLNLMPKTMGQLAIVQFFTWLALFSMWIYTTAAVTSHIYGVSDTTSELYNKGANWVGTMFAFYSGFAALVAFLLPVLAKFTSRKFTHAFSLVLGGLGLASIYIFKDPWMLIISMFGVGVAWASILSMPYAILTGSLPSNKMGVYMGIFNFFIVIPQILAATILGFMVTKLFNGQTVLALVFGGCSLLIAALCMLFVEDVDEKKYRQHLREEKLKNLK